MSKFMKLMKFVDGNILKRKLMKLMKLMNFEE